MQGLRTIRQARNLQILPQQFQHFIIHLNKCRMGCATAQRLDAHAAHSTEEIQETCILHLGRDEIARIFWETKQG